MRAKSRHRQAFRPRLVVTGERASARASPRCATPEPYQAGVRVQFLGAFRPSTNAGSSAGASSSWPRSTTRCDRRLRGSARRSSSRSMKRARPTTTCHPGPPRFRCTATADRRRPATSSAGVVSQQFPDRKYCFVQKCRRKVGDTASRAVRVEHGLQCSSVPGRILVTGRDKPRRSPPLTPLGVRLCPEPGGANQPQPGRAGRPAMRLPVTGPSLAGPSALSASPVNGEPGTWGGQRPREWLEGQ